MNTPEGLCLRYPESLAPQPALPHDVAVSMLLRATQLAQHTPFVWGYIDKPSEGQVFLIFITQQLPLPPDGLRFQEQEQRYTIPVGNGREMEVTEVKSGFIPGQDNSAFRVRRRFRLTKGGHPQLVLIHYSRGQPISIVPSLNIPVRAYPLRPVNEPAVYVMGEKVGQKVYTNMGGPQAQAAIAERQQSLPPASMGLPFNGAVGPNAQALLAQQNSNMEALERRSQRERSTSMNTGQQSRIEEEDMTESDMISTRTLALTRYRRNHELMNEVFMYAAFGDKEASVPASLSSMFNEPELAEKVAKLNAEIDDLRIKAAARQDARLSSSEERVDVSMEFLEAEGIAAA